MLTLTSKIIVRRVPLLKPYLKYDNPEEEGCKLSGGGGCGLSKLGCNPWAQMSCGGIR